MKPMPCKRLVCSRLALCDLIFVVREHEVFATGVEVDVVAE